MLCCHRSDKYMTTHSIGTIITKNQEELLKSRLPIWHTLLHEHWDYYLRLLRETWRSEKTIANTLTAIRLFLLHSSCISLESWMNGRVIQEEFIRLKNERKWSDSTYNTHRKGMSSYLRVLSDAGFIKENPIVRIKKCPEVPWDQLKFKDNQPALFFQTINTYKTWMSYLLFHRNKLFFLLCGYTGARPIELLSLKLNSFSSDRNTLSVVSAKWSGKTRMYQLTDDVQEALRSYIRECAAVGRDKELNRNFFLGDNLWMAWTSSGVQQVCKRLSMRIGFKVTAYMFRRFVATKMFENKVLLQDIQHHMGHTRASTTLRYVQSNERMNEMGISIMHGIIGVGRDSSPSYTKPFK